MPRNRNGTYARPAGQPVVTGTTIDATVFNNLTADLAAEITDSLDRSGKGPMLAPLELPNGDELAPSLTFADNSIGLYVDGTNLGFTAGGAMATFAQTGADFSVPLTASGQAITPVSQVLGSNWTGTVTRWVDTLSKEAKLHGSALTGASANNVVMVL